MVRGPGELNLHTTLAKNFSLGEKRLQVRADVFNVLNRKNYTTPNNPQTNMNNADFGRITGAARPRVFQVGARLTF
jgi:outer membrane receptor protein involved in Fe transport